MKKPKFTGWIFSASILMFVSSNVVNAGNMLFNLLFSRWMGPELFSDLAFLLTLKLSILGVLNAVQFLVTERIASVDSQSQRSYISTYRKLANRFGIITFMSIPVLIAFSLYGDWANKIGLHNPSALLVFYFGIPFYLPLALWRGVAQGRIDMHRIVMSANVEMLVRLIGGALFWWMGLGVPSVIFAFVLSLASAWYVARPKLPTQFLKPAPLSMALPWQAAVPWAMIQIAVILLLDGDVFVTKMLISANEAGLIAAISIVQRIIFFSCFSLAAILLPQAIRNIDSGGLGLRSLFPIALLIVGSSTFVLLLLRQFPEMSVAVLFGEKFEQIAPLLFTAGLSATLITVSYFIVVFLMAHKIKYSAYLFLAIAIGQLIFLGSSIEPHANNVAKLVDGKVVFQSISTTILLIIAIFQLYKKQRISKRTVS